MFSIGNSSRTAIRVILLSVLLFIVSLSFLGEKVAKDDGIGWDGEIYLETIQHFSNKIISHGYTQYGIHRILPYGLLNLTFKLFDIPITTRSALIGGAILDIIALFFCVCYFFRISTFLNWKSSSEIIAFSSLFYSYPILKVLGYYILQSDIFAFLLGLMLVYFFIVNQRKSLVVCGIVGAFIWPVASLCAFALAFFPRNPLTIYQSFTGRKDKFSYWTIYLSLALIPVLFWIYWAIRSGYLLIAINNGRLLTILILFVTSLCSTFYLGYVIRPFRLARSEVFALFKSKETWGRFLLFLLFLFGVYALCRFLASDEVGAVSVYSLTKRVLLSGMNYPLSNVESFFVFYGPVILIILFCWPKICFFISNKGLGYFFIIALGIFFSLDSEARISFMFLPFFIIPAMEYIDSISWRYWVPVTYMAICIVLSHCWFPINVDGMDCYLSWENLNHYGEFPAQRYFMFTGRWQNREIYILFIIVTFLVASVLYLGKRNKWFIEDSLPNPSPLSTSNSMPN